MEITRKQSSDFTRAFDILAYQHEKYPNAAALNSFVDTQWVGHSIETIQYKVNAISCWFIRNGYARGEKIIFVPEMGSPEWMMLDFACQQVGLISVPVHPTLHVEEIELILEETESRLCIAANESLYNKYVSLQGSNKFKFETYHVQANLSGYFQALQSEKTSNDELKKLIEIKSAITPDDILSIMYTSGSSGVPKGVLLSHGNIVHNVKSILPLFPIEPKHRVLSFLPFSHILERMACYSYLAFGVPLYFSQSKESLTQDFKTVKPHFCTSVPRVLEKMYDFMEEQLLHRNFIKRKLIGWAMKVGKQYGQEGHLKFWFFIKLFTARTLVLSQWRKRLGGKIQYMVVGAAALRPEIGRLFSAAGIQVIEGYGMTETAPLITINRYEPGLNRFGTVGLAIPGIDIKIDQPNEHHEGEILVKGPNVMKGYFKRPELTKEVFTDDGWFRTGDIGKIVHQRFLKITDRKKDIFKTSSGKYIAPQPLQNHFMKSPFMQRCLIVGFQRAFVAALIVPNFEVLQAWCVQEQIHWTSPQFMVHNIKVRAKVQQEIDRLNETLPNFERMRDFVLCHEDWTPEKGELTTTLKPIRQKLMTNYESEIEKMYS